ncbi:MAG: Ribonuclease 3 [Candidatus Magasanikbacteria bacterium GW2011_GWA2_46_17]|uniref:Ribonuclease 3 n=1 Tax=Candidatus Magasanikbacteria bacterium GW2011_GWA2_46_17 TaxID=1619042 RepID=A0A0G1S235_9BACT|nr:MAG: Ribonuclease 3 [Candidatus Magasanikbacteria bacterium GW2011_GWA2_46_17]HBF67186.1 ribonuclease III [Candidatus Magasanikbacteria bacterium]
MNGDEKNFHELEEKIGVTFKSLNVLRQALVHRSFLNEHHDFELSNNERLEFLGDAVLELVVTEFLFQNYLNPEGELTNWRAALVNSDMLSSVAHEIGIESFLYLSRGEAQDAGTKAREYILANAMEAVIGAIYIDLGWDMAKQFVTRWILVKLPEILELGLHMDPKSRFQEAAQEFVGATPTYRVLEEEGPDHAKHFKVGVYLDKEMIAEGEGSSKQEAQVEAAERALKIKEWKGPRVNIMQKTSDVPKHA